MKKAPEGAFFLHKLLLRQFGRVNDEGQTLLSKQQTAAAFNGEA
jgi:hypothetical protein